MFAIVELLNGTVNLETLIYISDQEKSTEIPVRRAMNKDRSRPNAE